MLNSFIVDVASAPFSTTFSSAACNPVRNWLYGPITGPGKSGSTDSSCWFDDAEPLPGGIVREVVDDRGVVLHRLCDRQVRSLQGPLDLHRRGVEVLQEVPAGGDLGVVGSGDEVPAGTGDRALSGLLQAGHRPDAQVESLHRVTDALGALDRFALVGVLHDRVHGRDGPRTVDQDGRTLVRDGQELVDARREGVGLEQAVLLHRLHPLDDLGAVIARELGCRRQAVVAVAVVHDRLPRAGHPVLGEPPVELHDHGCLDTGQVGGLDLLGGGTNLGQGARVGGGVHAGGLQLRVVHVHHRHRDAERRRPEDLLDAVGVANGGEEFVVELAGVGVGGDAVTRGDDRRRSRS